MTIYFKANENTLVTVLKTLGNMGVFDQRADNAGREVKCNNSLEKV